MASEELRNEIKNSKKYFMTNFPDVFEITHKRKRQHTVQSQMKQPVKKKTIKTVPAPLKQSTVSMAPLVPAQYQPADY